MGKRTNTAQWVESTQRWRVSVQKDGVRKQFYYYRWRIYCRVNELQAVSPYELRHTFVSVVKTLPAGEVKPLVGHSTDMDTFGVYGHALTGDAENTAQAVNSVFLRVLKQA